MIELSTPLTDKEVKNLRIGDMVQINGILYTARDAVHEFLLKTPQKKWKKKLKNGIVFHCGPIVRKIGRKWKVVSLGPTTSIRMEPYESQFIKTYGIKGIIGKGGMGNYTLKSLKKYGCVYLLTVGGSAALLAQSVIEVRNVYMLKKFGIPEAIWELEVEGFPAIVTMDAKGNSIHEQVLNVSSRMIQKMMK